MKFLLLFVVVIVLLDTQVVRSRIVWGCNRLDRSVALTYDDGPSERTMELLDVLKEHNVTATFFVVGGNAETYHEAVQRMDEDGHDIGSHTWTHANLTSLLDPSSSEYDPIRFEDEINRTEDLLVNLTGKKPRFIRPPYGAINQEVYDYLVKRGYIIVMWNMGCNDWYFKNGTIENKIYLSGIADAGAIICLHDNKYPEFLESDVELIGELKQTNNLPWANPQGRKLIGMEECVYDEHYSIQHVLVGN